jgi:hypothetical protein
MLRERRKATLKIPKSYPENNPETNSGILCSGLFRSGLFHSGLFRSGLFRSGLFCSGKVRSAQKVSFEVKVGKTVQDKRQIYFPPSKNFNKNIFITKYKFEFYSNLKFLVKFCCE